MSPKANNPDTAAITYAAAITEIEDILEEMNSATLDVDTLAAKVARANTLLEICKTKLLKTQKEVEKIIKQQS